MLKRISVCLLSAVSIIAVAAPNASVHADDDIQDVLMKSDLMMASGKYSKVRRILGECVQEHPNNVEVLLRLGISQSMLNEYDAAEETFKRALEIEPANAKTLHNLGLMFLRQKKFDRAEDYFRKTLSVREWHPETNYHLGFIFEKRGQRAEALECYIKEFNHNSKCAKAWQRYMILKSKEQPEKERISATTAIAFAVICVALSGCILWFRWTRKTEM